MHQRNTSMLFQHKLRIVLVVLFFFCFFLWLDVDCFTNSKNFFSIVGDHKVVITPSSPSPIILNNPASLTAFVPVEKYGLPVQYDQSGKPTLLFSPEIKRVLFEVGLFQNPYFCDLPAKHPDVFVIAWEANIASWEQVYERCKGASGGRFIALPYAAAGGQSPMLWNTADRQDACASLAIGDGGDTVKPATWIDDPLTRARTRCNALLAKGEHIRLWDEEVAADKRDAMYRSAMEGCLSCRDRHAEGHNTLHRVGILSLESVLQAIPEHISIDLVKIDAQGADLAVFKSAGSLMHRISRVHLEVQNLSKSDPDFLYTGPLVSTMEEMKLEMGKLGFPFHVCEVNNCACLEYNCYFSQFDNVTSGI